MRQAVRFAVALVLCLVLCLSGVMVGDSRTYASSVGWVERRPAGDVGREWHALASDSTGTHLIAAAFGNYGTEGWVYTSTNGGASWAQTYPNTWSSYWMAAASDADGSNLIICVWAGLVYTSSNGGVDWATRYPAGETAQRWQTVASDADGSNLIAGTSTGRLWISKNGGSTWTETRPAGNDCTLPRMEEPTGRKSRPPGLRTGIGKGQRAMRMEPT